LSRLSWQQTLLPAEAADAAVVEEEEGRVEAEAEPVRVAAALAPAVALDHRQARQ
jgi:hypothetical protein